VKPRTLSRRAVDLRAIWSSPIDPGYAVITVTMCSMMRNKQDKQKRHLISDRVLVKAPIVTSVPSHLGSWYCSMKQPIYRRWLFAVALSAGKERTSSFIRRREMSNVTFPEAGKWITGRRSNPYTRGLRFSIWLYTKKFHSVVSPRVLATELDGGFGFRIDIIYFEYKRHYTYICARARTHTYIGYIFRSVPLPDFY